jgi:hypothetical protein
MGKMKEVYMEVWEEHGGQIPPGYTLADYLAKEKAEHELEIRKEQESVEDSEKEESKEVSSGEHNTEQSTN